jgi:hypothetical protein
MTSPIDSPLIPSLSGRQLTVDYALRQPSMIRNQIARLADPQILLPKVCRQFGVKVEGGALLYNSVQASDFFTSDIEQRMPGSEYKTVEGVDPDPQLALVEDWGGRFKVPIEVVNRNNVNYLDQQTVQLANTITRKLDTRVVAALTAANIGSIAPASGWSNLVMVGPLDAITPSAARPSAHFASAQELADLEELGQHYDLLIVHPAQAAQLRTAYDADLERMLTSAGFTKGMFVSPRIPAGTAYMVVSGGVGVCGFEIGLTVNTWEDYATRSWFVQAFAVPAFAIDRPYAAKKITSLS